MDSQIWKLYIISTLLLDIILSKDSPFVASISTNHSNKANQTLKPQLSLNIKPNVTSWSDSYEWSDSSSSQEETDNDGKKVVKTTNIHRQVFPKVLIAPQLNNGMDEHQGLPATYHGTDHANHTDGVNENPIKLDQAIAAPPYVNKQTSSSSPIYNSLYRDVKSANKQANMGSLDLSTPIEPKTKFNSVRSRKNEAYGQQDIDDALIRDAMLNTLDTDSADNVESIARESLGNLGGDEQSPNQHKMNAANANLNAIMQQVMSRRNNNKPSPELPYATNAQVQAQKTNSANAAPPKSITTIQRRLYMIDLPQTNSGNGTTILDNNSKNADRTKAIVREVIEQTYVNDDNPAAMNKHQQQSPRTRNNGRSNTYGMLDFLMNANELWSGGFN